MKRRLQVVQESSCRARHGRHGGGDGGRGDLLVRAELRELGLRVRGGGLRLRTRPVALGGRPGTRGARIWRFSRIRVRGLPLRAGGRNHRDGRLRAVPLGSAPRRLGALRLALHLAEKLLRVTPICTALFVPMCSSIFLHARPCSLSASRKRWCSSSVHRSRCFVMVYGFRTFVATPRRSRAAPPPLRLRAPHLANPPTARRRAARAVRAEPRRARAGISGRDARARRATCTGFVTPGNHPPGPPRARPRARSATPREARTSSKPRARAPCPCPRSARRRPRDTPRRGVRECSSGGEKRLEKRGQKARARSGVGDLLRARLRLKAHRIFFGGGENGRAGGNTWRNSFCEGG